MCMEVMHSPAIGGNLIHKAERTELIMLFQLPFLSTKGRNWKLDN